MLKKILLTLVITGLAVLLLQLTALYSTALIIYYLIRKVYDSHWGILASIGLLIWWWPAVRYLTIGVFSPAVLAGLAIVSSAYLLIWSLEKISVKRSVILGVVLAFSCLILAAGMLFVPLAVLLTFILKRPMKPLAWAPALAIVATVGVILMPWALRNYAVFGQFIPIRTGFGLALHQSRRTDECHQHTIRRGRCSRQGPSRSATGYRRPQWRCC